MTTAFTTPSGLPLVIAEVGFNHEGDMDAAEAMIRAAASAGADMVKFQTFKALDLALPSAPHFDLIRPGEMSLDDMKRLAEVARQCGIEFFSTPFSPQAVDMLEEVGVAMYKVASMDLTNGPLLRKIAATGKPVVISTGMATLAEITAGVEVLRNAGAREIAVLHCISKYPADAKDLNLAAIGRLKDSLGVTVGYSDHYPGIDACLASFFHGAQVIETHFTLDTTREGGDHGHSVDPAMLADLVAKMRLFTDMAGTRDFYTDRPDREFSQAFRRGVYAARDLAAGETLAEEDLLFCRPANELEPNDLEWMLGRTLSAPVPGHEPLTRSHLMGAQA